MTKKDYKLIAAVIDLERQQANGRDAAAVLVLAHRLATALADDNPRFDRARFLAACGVT